MRLAGIEKLGYYPTSNEVTNFILNHLKAPKTYGRVLDPCCGEGEALEIIGKGLEMETYGVELSNVRAEKAKARLFMCFAGPYSSVNNVRQGFSLVFLNPPYNDDRLGDGRRLEYEFLKAVSPSIMEGGVLVYIIPRNQLANNDIAHHLAGKYHDINIYDYPGSPYDQIVILAYRNTDVVHPTKEQIAAVKNLPVQSIETPAMV